jgi:hypothetical protein
MVASLSQNAAARRDFHIRTAIDRSIGDPHQLKPSIWRKRSV